MERLRNGGLVAFVLLVVVSVFVDIGYGFFCYFNHDTTTDYFNINDQTPLDIQEVKDSGKLSEEEINELEDRKLFEVNLYSNIDEPKPGKKTGIILEELRINHFTNPSLSTASIVETGMQYISDYDGKKGLYNDDRTFTWFNTPTASENLTALLSSYTSNKVRDLKNVFDDVGKELNIVYKSSAEKEFKTQDDANNYVNADDFVYYEKVGQGVRWDARGLQTQLNRKTVFIVKIGDEAYKLRLDKYEDKRWDNRPASNSIAWLLPNNWFNVNNYGGHIEYYNWDMVFCDIMHAVTTNNMGTGIHYGAVNLSKYFTVTEHYNTETKRWEDATEADQQVTYAVVKFNYHTNGAVSNRQSMFGIIADDPRFELDDTTYDTDFGQAEFVLNLTTNSLEKRYSDAYNGYFLSMSIDLQRRLKAMPPYLINIDIDLNQKIDNKSIVGLDANAFTDFKLNKLTIRGNQDFYLLDNSLRGTNVELDIASGVRIIDVNSGVNA